jgi:hypothetical protein
MTTQLDMHVMIHLQLAHGNVLDADAVELSHAGLYLTASCISSP